MTAGKIEMKDAELIRIAREFRKGMLGKRSSAYCCAMVCLPLAGLLEFYGLKAELVESDLGHINHVWLRLPDGRALDPTADQFNDRFLPKESRPAVYLGPPLDIHPAPDNFWSSRISAAGRGGRSRRRCGTGAEAQSAEPAQNPSTEPGPSS